MKEFDDAYNELRFIKVSASDWHRLTITWHKLERKVCLRLGLKKSFCIRREGKVMVLYELFSNDKEGRVTYYEFSQLLDKLERSYNTTWFRWVHVDHNDDLIKDR